MGDIVYGLRTNTLPEVTARQNQFGSCRQVAENHPEEVEEDEGEEEKGVGEAKRLEDLLLTPLKGKLNCKKI